MGATPLSTSTTRPRARLPAALGLFAWLALILGLSSNPAWGEKILYLNTALTYPLSTATQTGFVDRLVQQALERLGYRLHISHLPAERALINANAGIDDGDLLRIGGLSTLYPNLVQVPEKVIDMDFVAFTRQRQLRIDGWASLPGHAVAIINGWKILEQNIPPETRPDKVKNARQLFTLLLKDRADLVLYSRWAGLGFLSRNQIHGIKILEPPLAKRAMFVYLNKKHRELVPRLAASLRQLKADGSYQRIFEQTLSPVLRN